MQERVMYRVDPRLDGVGDQQVVGIRVRAVERTLDAGIQ
jgi:hypothetical protein